MFVIEGVCVQTNISDLMYLFLYGLNWYCSVAALMWDRKEVLKWEISLCFLIIS